MKRRLLLTITTLLLLCLTVTVLFACNDGSTAETSEQTQPSTQAEVAETNVATEASSETSAQEEVTMNESNTTQEQETQAPATEVVTEAPATEEPETEAPATEEPATEAPATQEPETQEPETETPVAGMDSGIVRDGTPKKYFTIRFDDGITQDIKVMEILKKYNADCCTFYINTGLMGANWTWVGQQFNRPDVTHLRFNRKELKSGIYNGFDVESHTLSHPSLKNYTDAQVTREVAQDAKNITSIFGVKPVGLAWPGGDTEFNDHNIETILATTDIRYGSCTTRNVNMGLGKFSLPQYFMRWYPTCSFSDGDSMTLLNEFIAAPCEEDMLFFVWCHGYELDLFNTWEKFDLYIKTITEAAAKDDSIVLVTNAEFYQLFKDEIPSWK